MITTNTLEQIVRVIKANDMGIRTSSVVIANPISGETIYTPPAGERIIRDKLHSLEEFILKNRADYYRLLRGVTEQDYWLDWIHFMLKAIDETARATLILVNDISQLMIDVSSRAKHDMSVGYSMELIQTVFQNPYCKIAHLVQAGIASRWASLSPFRCGRA